MAFFDELLTTVHRNYGPQPNASSAEAPPIDPQAIIGALPAVIAVLRESGVKISGRAEMDMEGLDPLTGLGTKPASYRVVIEFTL